MLDPEMFSDYGMFMFFYSLMEKGASVLSIICIAQITCEFIYYTLAVKSRKITEKDTRFQSVTNLQEKNSTRAKVSYY